jgi:hypothetical protein
MIGEKYINYDQFGDSSKLLTSTKCFGLNKNLLETNFN